MKQSAQAQAVSEGQGTKAEVRSVAAEGAFDTQGEMDERLNESPRMVAQRRKMAAFSDAAAQRKVAQPVVQMTRQRLANFIQHNHYAAGALTTTMDYGTMGADIQATLRGYLEAAELQHAVSFFHANEAGLLPAHGWESRECSRYVEFNIGFAEFNRVIYDAATGNIYLTPHYNGYIRVNNPPGGAVAHMEAAACENVGYALRDWDVERARDFPTAWQKITALHSYQQDQEALGM